MLLGRPGNLPHTVQQDMEASGEIHSCFMRSEEKGAKSCLRGPFFFKGSLYFVLKLICD